MDPLWNVLMLPTEWMGFPQVIYMFIIPFLVVFGIVFGLLKVSKIFEKDPKLRLLLAFVITLSALPTGLFRGLVGIVASLFSIL